MVRAATHGGAAGRPRKLDVAVGQFYQISHVNLPPRTSFWLKSSIRVVMVNEKNKFKVTVRFPSQESVEAYLSKSKTSTHPDLDMCFIMGMKLAQRVLVRQVSTPKSEYIDDLKDFWLMDTALTPKVEPEDASGKYLCSSTIESEEDKFDEINNNEVCALVVVKEEKVDQASALVAVKGENVDEGYAPDESHKKKKYKYWSNESFEAGRRVILKILKEKKAVADNPIYRVALRKEAQKEIGNTGLLDHLLKDIPGKLAPDGISRFQRCYNANGVIMYWMESADLIDIRNKAGVTDPFWIPPPGWKLGSCSTSTACSCAQELELLKEDLDKVKRELEETKKQLNEVCNGDMRRCYDCSNWVGGFW